LKQAFEEADTQVDPALDPRGSAGGASAAREGGDERPPGEGEIRQPRQPVERKEPPGKVRARLQAVRDRPLAAAGIAIVLIACVTGGVLWWLNARQYESTDDAFIDARTISISSQVNGAIVEVAVTDNQSVAANALLLRIDDRDYRSAVDQAKAQIDQAIAGSIQWLCSFIRLWTAAWRRHSERTAGLPRRWNRRKPRLNLFWANTGSTVAFRCL